MRNLLYRDENPQTPGRADFDNWLKRQGRRIPKNLLTHADHSFTLRKSCVAALRTDRHQIGLSDRHHRNTHLRILCGTAAALDPSQPAGSYILTSFTAEDGLPSDVVNAAIQTRDGFLWVGTSGGLARFDGHHFMQPRISSRVLAIRRSLALAEGPDLDLWDGANAGVLRIQRVLLNQSTSFSPEVYHAGKGAGDVVTCLRFAHDGVLWAGTNEGLYRFENGAFRQVIPGLLVSRIEEDKTRRLL